MPKYEYTCECSVDQFFIKERSIMDAEPDYLCERCGDKLKRHFGTFGVQFKGGGFYSTGG